MKKFSFLAALAIAFAGLWACNPTDEITPGIDITGQTEITVPCTTDEVISISFNATVDWTAEVAEEWLNVSPKSGKAGDATIKVTVDDNEAAESRTAKITITADKVVKEVTIIQEGAFIPHFDVDPSSCQFSGFGDGEPYSVAREACEFVIPVSTNLEWDVYLALWTPDGTITTDTNGWLTVSKVNEGIKVVISTDNETYDARVEYVYVACHVGEDYDNYGGFGACILISQAGLDAPTTPTLVWTKKFSDISENLASTIYNRLAYSEGEIMVSDGNAVYGLDPATGDLWDTFDVKAQSFDSDDEGNLLIMNEIPAEYDGDGNVVGPELKLMWTQSIYNELQPFYTMSYANQAWGTLGNFRVRGNMASGKAVITAAVGASRFYYGWAFNNGEYVVTSEAFDPIRSSLNATGDGNTPDQIGVISVAPDNLTEGVIYRGYVLGQTGIGAETAVDQSTFLRVDPTVPQWSNPEWKLVSTLGASGNECQNCIDILDIAGKRIMAYTQGGHFGWIGNANIFVFDITDLNNIKVLANVDTAEWIDTDNPVAVRGSDILLRANGDNVELYAIRANGGSVAKYIFGLE